MDRSRVVNTRVACVTLLLVASFSNVSYGHGGRLASDGCHNDKSAGTRHCHNGGSHAAPASDDSPIANPPANNQLTTDSSLCDASTYDRSSWGYKSRSFSTNTGYYSGNTCADIDIDHVVALKDAHTSGGCKWSKAQKSQFANDVSNLVPSCARINRSKSSALPAKFIARADDGRGVEFAFAQDNICAYLTKYKEAKAAYGLSFVANDPTLFQTCGISLP